MIQRLFSQTKELFKWLERKIIKAIETIKNYFNIIIPKFQTKYGLRKNIVQAVPMYIDDESKISLLKELLLKNY